MPWKRRAGHPYFYRSYREGGRVRQKYVGRGPAAQVLAALIDLERLDCEAERQWQAAEREPYEKAEAPVREVFDHTQRALGTLLEAAGFHQHHRGEWRRRRCVPT